MKADGLILWWNLSVAERELVSKIAERFCHEFPNYVTRIQVMMDITAVHLNGCSLDLAGLAASGPFDLLHDVMGIVANLERETGRLRNHFLPRFARKEVQS